MRFASFGALSLLLSTACGGSSAAPEVKAPVAVTEVTLEPEGSAASEAPADDDPTAKNRALLEEMQTAGVLGALSSDQGEAVAALFGSSSLDADVGGLQGATVGEAFGTGGLGLSGIGRGGGGTGQGTIGIGTIGLGSGGGVGAGTGSGYGGFGSARRRSGPEPQVKLDMPVVQGRLDVQVVRRVLRRHLPQLRYCYAKQQVQAPQLAGQVRVEFTIAPDGQVVGANVESSTLQNTAVESCLLARIGILAFPEPDQGVVIVSVGMDFSTPPAPPPTPTAGPPAPPASSGGAP